MMQSGNPFDVFRFVQKGDVLFPGQADHDEQTVTPGCVQQFTWRNAVRTDGIKTVRRHAAEVSFHHIQIIFPELPIGRALNTNFLSPCTKYLPASLGRSPETAEAKDVLGVIGWRRVTLMEW